MSMGFMIYEMHGFRIAIGCFGTLENLNSLYSSRVASVHHDRISKQSRDDIRKWKSMNLQFSLRKNRSVQTKVEILRAKRSSQILTAAQLR